MQKRVYLNIFFLIDALPNRAWHVAKYNMEDNRENSFSRKNKLLIAILL